MLKRLRKSSSHVTLVLIGVAALGGCSGSDQRQDVYASREDCLADWGNKPEDCIPATQANHASRGYWYGPSYMYHSGGSGWTWGSSGRSTHSIGSTHHSSSSSSHVSRGGFGASGHSSSG